MKAVPKNNAVYSETTSDLAGYISILQEKLFSFQKNNAASVASLASYLTTLASNEQQLLEMQQFASIISNLLKNREDKINSEPNTIRNNPNPLGDEIDIPPFYFKLSLWEKVEFLFLNVKSEATAATLQSKIFELEPEIDENHDLRKKTILNLYSTLNNKTKARELIRTKENGEYLYKLAENKRD